MADLRRGGHGHDALADALGQVLIERQHAVVAAGLHERRDLVRLALADQAPDGRRRGQDLGDHRPPLAVGPRRQRLCDDALETGRELRDLETTATALTAAETGHLVLATLHTQSATQTIDRVIDIFPPHQQLQIRAQLAASLQGVVTQALAPKADGKGRVVVSEILTATPAIRSLIREGKSHQIPSFMQAGGNEGMLAFDQHLAERVREGLVTVQTAMEICHSQEELKRLIGRM